MAAPPTTTESRARRARRAAAVRRAPFSENPRSGRGGSARGSGSSTRRCRCSATRATTAAASTEITKRSGCSRVSFYQYFASKEDLFRHLAGQVARQVSASTEALDPLTPDLDGWAAMRAWVARYDEIHARYEPVFVRATRPTRSSPRSPRDTGDEAITRIHSRLVTDDASAPAARSRDPAAAGVPEPRARRRRHAPVGDAEALPAASASRTRITDVLHRTLFGAARRRQRARVRRPATTRARVQPRNAATTLRHDDDALDAECIPSSPRSALLASGRDVFVDARLPQHARRRSRRRGRRVPRRRSTGTSGTRMSSRGSSPRARCGPSGAAVLEIPDVSALDAAAGRARPAAVAPPLQRRARQRGGDAPRLGRRRARRSRRSGPSTRRRSTGAAGGCRATCGRGASATSTWRRSSWWRCSACSGRGPDPPAEVEAAAHIIERGLLGR